MKRLAAMIILSLLVSVPSCQAQFFKKLGQDLLNGATGQNMPGQFGGGTAGQPAGTTNMAPGQYMMTNMGTGQAFYILVDNNGQMYASIPNNNGMQPGMVQPGMGQAGVGQGGMGGLLQQGAGLLQGGGQQQGFGQTGMQQQQQPGVGGMMRGALGNFLQNQVSPQAPQQQY